MIPAELFDFLHSGLSALIGTCDPSLRPACCRAVGVVIHEGGTTMTVFVPDATAERTIANLRHSGHLALTMCRPENHRSVQLKGRVTSLRMALPTERATVERYIDAFADSVDAVGMPRSRAHQLSSWPAWAIELTVEQLFTQTPGPRAGMPLEAGRDA